MTLTHLPKSALLYICPGIVNTVWRAYANCQTIYFKKCHNNSPTCPVPAARPIPGTSIDELRLEEESHRQMEIFWGKILGGSLIGGGVVIGGPAVIAPVLRLLGTLGRAAVLGVP